MFAQHPKVMMGIERYGHRAFPSDFSLSPELFEYERFIDFRTSDTFYDGPAFAPAAYSGMEQKFRNARWVGDKIPTLFRTLPKLFDSFPVEARVLFIFRNIFDVAASYKARKNNDSDNWSKGVPDAIADWTDAIRSFRTSHHQDKIIPIIYEDLFSDERQAVELFRQLGLEVDPAFANVIKPKFDS